MRIKHLSVLIYNEAKDYRLQNSKVVIDGQNFFHKTYADSGLPYVYGVESDKYAQYLRSYLGMFKKANVKCYVLFKGGHDDPSRMLKKYKENKSEQFVIGKTPEIPADVKPPIFMKEIYKQVLEEMNFDYVICQYESKRECIAFAQKHNCPIISDDIEFCFSGVPYIPVSIRIKFDINRCKLFILDDFMRKFRLNEDKLAIFIMLTDAYTFPENHFQVFMKAMKIPLYSQYKRNVAIFEWLSIVNSEIALRQIFKYVTPNDQRTFLEKNKEVKAFIRRQEKLGLPSLYLENRNSFQILKNDPQWFEKGVVTKAIAIPYVNLYRWNTIMGSWGVTAEKNAPDSLLLSLDIIKYAFGLLCNFGKCEFKYTHETDAGALEDISVEISSNFQKPNYPAIESPFENGWSQVRSLGLFEHFLTETLQIFDFTTLDTLPEDAKLLVIALVYFSRKKPESTINEVCSVLLSYLVLNVLTDIKCRDPEAGLASRPILDAATNIDSIEHQDKLVAKQMLVEYLDKLPENKAAIMADIQKINALLEFQHCLEHLNFLNRLCGRPYQSTVYSKTFNGTVVYRTLVSLRTHEAGTLAFFENLLNQAPTVLAFWNDLIRVYQAML